MSARGGQPRHVIRRVPPFSREAIVAIRVPWTERKRAPRADSLRNRARLLTAAREVFSAGGAEASLEAVARAAKVGIATLYRHFPTREALYQAVYAAEVDELVALADRVGGAPSPGDAVKAWLHSGVRMMATKKGMIEALAPAIDPSAQFYADNGARMRGSLARLLDGAVAAGELRGDVSAEDLIRVMVGLCAAREAPDWQERAMRLLDVFVDGLAHRR